MTRETCTRTLHSGHEGRGWGPTFPSPPALESPEDLNTEVPLVTDYCRGEGKEAGKGKGHQGCQGGSHDVAQDTGLSASGHRSTFPI